MATTANYGFETPDGTAPPNGPYWFKRLADMIDAKLFSWFQDSGWQDCTVAAGFAAMGGAEKPQARKIGNRVYVRGGVLGTGITANMGGTVVATLPAGMAPPVNDIRALGSSAGNVTATGFVQTGGELSIRTGSTVGSYYKFDRCYLVD